jgi:hypothetical protein
LPGTRRADVAAVAGRASSSGRQARVEQRKSSTMQYQKKDLPNPARMCGNRGSNAVTSSADPKIFSWA